METSAPNVGESRAALKNGMDRASTDCGPRQAKANLDSTSSIHHVLHPIVQITSADSVKRLGEGAYLPRMYFEDFLVRETASEPASRTSSITDVALSRGYAQISSFSSAFRKATGWTPTVYRREFE
jgi:AraC-like DNA-binding protein